jgi:F-type H+/Na+-transporting ATPase subunit alpha
VPVEKINEFEKGLYQYIKNNNEEIAKEITEKKELTEGLEKKITKTVEDYKSTLDYLLK